MKLIANVNGLRDVNGKDVAKDAEFDADERYARIFVKLGKARELGQKTAAKATPEPMLPLRTAAMTPENATGEASGGERPRRRYQRRDLVAED